MEQTKKVKDLETKYTKDGKEYLTVTWEDEKFDNVFSGEHMEMVNRAHEMNLPVRVIKVQEGKYWNITELTIIAEDTSPKPAQELVNDYNKEHNIPRAETKKAMLDPTNIPEVVRARSMALSYAKDKGVAKLQAGVEVSDEDDIKTAKRYMKYIAMGD